MRSIVYVNLVWRRIHRKSVTRLLSFFPNLYSIRITFDSYLCVLNTFKKMLFAFYIIDYKAPIVTPNTTKRMDNFKKLSVYSFNRMFVRMRKPIVEIFCAWLSHVQKNEMDISSLQYILSAFSKSSGLLSSELVESSLRNHYRYY